MVNCTSNLKIDVINALAHGELKIYHITHQSKNLILHPPNFINSIGICEYIDPTFFFQ